MFRPMLPMEAPEIARYYSSSQSTTCIHLLYESCALRVTWFPLEELVEPSAWIAEGHKSRDAEHLWHSLFKIRAR